MEIARFALWADKLRDVSALGLYFADNIYDRDRYQAVQDIAMAMFASVTDSSLDELEPLRVPLFSRPTPLVGGDAAVIDDRGHILLIQRADNHRWAMPGGALEVGETPIQGVLREVYEETGIECQAEALVGVFDSRLCGLDMPFHIYLLTFLCRPVAGGGRDEPSHDIEVLDVRWFGEDALPEDIHPGNALRIREAYRVWRGGGEAYYDVPEAGDG